MNSDLWKQGQRRVEQTRESGTDQLRGFGQGKLRRDLASQRIGGLHFFDSPAAGITNSPVHRRAAQSTACATDPRVPRQGTPSVSRHKLAV